MGKDNQARVIIHMDCDSFYASVEEAQDPSLHGKPIGIVGNKRKGFIITCSYAARAKGVHTLMFVEQAKKLCPNIVLKTPNFPLYKQESQRIFAFLFTITSLIQVASIDECYMDVTDVYKEFGGARELIQYIQKHIENEIGVTVSCGCAPNMYLAKMASQLQKPRGITILRKREIHEKLWPLPIRKAHGIGEKSAALLQKAGIFTIRDFANMPKEKVRKLLGNRGLVIQERVQGHDDRTIDPEENNQVRTMSRYRTLPQDTDTEQYILDELFQLCRTISEQLQRRVLLTHNIQLTIRYANQERLTITRSRKLDQPIDTEQDIFHAAFMLWKKHWDGNIIRLIGITASDLLDKQSAYYQLSLFGDVQGEQSSLLPSNNQDGK